MLEEKLRRLALDALMAGDDVAVDVLTKMMAHVQSRRYSQLRLLLELLPPAYGERVGRLPLSREEDVGPPPPRA